MRIGIDARLINETGIGRYIRNLIHELSLLDKKNDFIVFLRKKEFESFDMPYQNWQKVLADVRWHTFAEQRIMPALLTKAHLDIVHIPYHNPPIFYGGRTVVTIHDLTILHFNTGKATRLPMPLYQLKRLGYWLELAVGLRKASKIITVSESTKREITSHFSIPGEKIRVTYEGVDNNLIAQGKDFQKKIVSVPYFLYVGNAYPHKNLEYLIRAWKIFKENSFPAHNLVLVGDDDYFYPQIKQLVIDSKLENSVIFFGTAKDHQLANLYQHAKALVFPSLMEGFGLPGLESLSFGCPVLASNITVFHEIFGEHASYFDPKDPSALAKELSTRARTSKLKMSSNLKTHLVGFSWKTMAKETLEIYENSVRV